MEKDIGGFTINFRPVQLEDKVVIDPFFRAKRYETSECTFTNLYIWRNAYNVQWTTIAGMLCITMTWEGETFFLPPYGDDGYVKQAMAAMLDYCKSTDIPFLMKGATTADIRRFEQAVPGRFVFQRDRDNDDYVHLTQELIELSGRKYSSKKNHMHFFKNNYPDYKFLRLSPDLVPDCIGTAYDWYVKKAGEDAFLGFEFNAVKDALEHFSPLGLRGGAIMIDGKVEAFSVGEPLSQDMVVIHVEKANSDIRGAYQMINQECCEYCWPEFMYVNREEDMGIPGLRKAKQSYRPVRMIEKYDITLEPGR